MWVEKTINSICYWKNSSDSSYCSLSDSNNPSKPQDCMYDLHLAYAFTSEVENVADAFFPQMCSHHKQCINDSA